jgi:hypothetical protein
VPGLEGAPDGEPLQTVEATETPQGHESTGEGEHR